MIILKHRYMPEPEHWKFACKCGCEWVSDDETEICKKYRDPKGVFVSCKCPECNDLVYSRCLIDANKYEKLFVQTDPSALIRYANLGSGITAITEEE